MKKIQTQPFVDFPLISDASNQFLDDEELMIDLDHNLDNKEKSFPSNYVPKELKSLIDRIDRKVCNICLDEEEEEDDIFQCSNCFYSTHRWCYGSELINNYPNYTEWRCQKCEFVKNNPKKAEQLKCIFCPFKVGILLVKKGIIKKITENEWAHIVCVNWDENIHYLNDLKEEINYKDINKEKFTLTCMFCKIRQGACIQCDVSSCSKSFHVICAIEKGLIKHWKTMEMKNSDEKEEKINVYCQNHSSRYNQKRKKNELNKSTIITAKKNVFNPIRTDLCKKDEKNKILVENEKIFRKNKEKLNDFRINDNKQLIDQIIPEKTSKKEKDNKKNLNTEIVDLTDDVEEDTQFLKKKVERKDEKYLLNPDLGRLLGIYYPLKYEEIIVELDRYLKSNNLIDKQDNHINVNKNEKLKKILECERISYNNLISKLEGFLKKADYNKEINENFKKNERENEINSNQKLTEINYTSESLKTNTNCNINPKSIHSNETIKKRSFFVKENALKLFKF